MKLISLVVNVLTPCLYAYMYVCEMVKFYLRRKIMLNYYSIIHAHSV